MKYAIKIFERDEKVLEKLNIPAETLKHIDHDIQAAEEELDDDAESIITNERYIYIASVIHSCYKKKNRGSLSTSDKIDKIVTNRWLGLPIFAVIMFLVYYISMVTVGTAATNWANDGLFGDGFHLFAIGSSEYEQHSEAIATIFGAAQSAGNEKVTNALDFGSGSYDGQAAVHAVSDFAASIKTTDEFTFEVEDEETLAVEQKTVTGKNRHRHPGQGRGEPLFQKRGQTG